MCFSKKHKLPLRPSIPASIRGLRLLLDSLCVQFLEAPCFAVSLFQSQAQRRFIDTIREQKDAGRSKSAGASSDNQLLMDFF